MRILTTPQTAPAEEPVTLAQCKLDSRIDGDELDDVIPSLIAAAREMAEQETARKFVTQTWRVTADDWPDDTDVIGGLTPYQSATVTYWDGAAWQTLATTQWVIQPCAGGLRMLPAYGVTWPTLGNLVGPRVRIDVTCGYGAADDVPASIGMWIRQHVAAMLRSPDGLGDDRKMVAMHWLRGLLDPHRAY